MGDSTGGGKDLRSAPRVRGAPKRALIRICPSGRRGITATATATVVHVRDCSCRGLGLIHTEPLDPGTEFVIELHRRSEVVRRLLYVVSRCRRWRDGGSFVIGARFVCLAEKTPEIVDLEAVESIRRAILA
jgi:hypothetical protein